MSTIRVVDCSYAQPGFSWELAAREGIQAGICKRSEGTAYLDPQFDSHWKAIKDAGLARAAYHFGRWDLGLAPANEAHWFLQHLPPLDASDVVVLDLEDSPAGILPYPLSSWALAWLAVVEHEVGFRPLLYSGAYFASQYLTDERLAPYGKWVAAYAQEPPQMSGPWSPYCMWQRTNEANVAGQRVDESVFYGDLDQLRAYGKPAPHQTPAQPATPHTTGARYMIVRPMMARSGPSRSAVLQTPQGPQWVNKGAVLAATGRRTAHWAECIAGGHAVWVFLENCQPC